MERKSLWWHKEEDRVVCDLCPRRCVLSEGQRGFCFVRQNISGQMALTTYGKSTGFCIDPIEKKPLNHFLPGTAVLSFGTAGCNLGCKFCQNWDISKSKEIEILSEAASPETIAFAAKETQCRSIAFTYNDPVIWAEYAIDTAIAGHDLGLKSVAVTAGYITLEARRDFYKYIDAANIDLKAFTEGFYKHLTLSHLEPVLDTLRWLKHETNVWFEITNLIIPSENDSDAELGKMVDWILRELGDSVPLHFTAFHPDYKLQNRPNTPPETLIRAREIARSAGVKFVYVGNVLDKERQSTYCPGCKALLIERDHYELGRYEIRSSACPSCSTIIPGVFEDNRGEWGRKREGIKIAEYAEKKRQRMSEQEKKFVFNAELDSICNQATEAAHAVSNLAEKANSHEQQNTAAETSKQALSQRAALALAPRTEYSSDELGQLLNFVRGVVAACLIPGASPAPLSPTLAEAPAYGVFVSLKRGPILRACRGHWGDPETGTLGALLQSASEGAALHDPRFPGITPQELPLLEIEISIMHSPNVIAGPPAARPEQINIGQHGLVLSHPKGRGLLLPHVATEQGWNVQTFLEHLSAKAGLPQDTWRDPRSELMSFETLLFDAPPPFQEFDARNLSRNISTILYFCVSELLQGRPLPEQLRSQLKLPIPSLTGICLDTTTAKRATSLLTATDLISLAERGAQALLRTSTGGEPLGDIARIGFLVYPIILRPDDFPERLGTIQRSAILIKKGEMHAVLFPDPRVSEDPVSRALSLVQSNHQDWIEGKLQIIAFNAAFIAPPEREIIPGRQPMCAGSFYPRTQDAIDQEVSRYLSPPVPQKAVRAVLLPHAGWRYCGDIIGKTLSQVQIPNKVIILGPKHTRYGTGWAVPEDDNWLFPGYSVPIASDLRKFLLDRVTQLAASSEAHRIEHGSEVLIPFLRAKNPHVEVLPIALQMSPLEDLKYFAEALAELLHIHGNQILLVISSDMHHFGDESTNHTLDALALKSFSSGDPAALYKTCERENISMCGVLPAALVLWALGKTKPEIVAYHTSGPITGDYTRVVGYAGALLP